MHDEKRAVLAAYRLRHAEKCLSEAVLLLNNNSFNGSTTRSYYAIFNSLRAVLALEGHQGGKAAKKAASAAMKQIREKGYADKYARTVATLIALAVDKEKRRVAEYVIEKL